MNRLNKKQKIIIIAISIIAILSFGYYIYGKEGSFAAGESLEIESIEKPEEITNEGSEKENIKVHISGAVNTEGLIELEENSRVADAIEKAGGVKENAYMEEVNLAYVLEDGMKIRISTKEEVQAQKNQKDQSVENSNNETEQKYITNVKTNYQNTNIVSTKTSTEQKNKTTSSKININTANQTELETLPGIGTATALKIINYRKESGKFKAIEDIKKVSGIGDAKFNSIKELISI